MTIDFEARRAPTDLRLASRSAVAGVDVTRARHTLAELAAAPRSFEGAVGRLIQVLRGLMVRDAQELQPRS